MKTGTMPVDRAIIFTRMNKCQLRLMKNLKTVYLWMGTSYVENDPKAAPTSQRTDEGVG